MNISISKNELSNVLATASHAITSNSPQPALRGIKIDAKGSSLTLTASNADISIRCQIDATEENHLNIYEEGSILVEAKYLNDIVRKTDADDIKIEVIDGALTRFSGNKAEFKINGMNPQDYPGIDFNEPQNSVTVKASLLSEIISQTAFAASIKETKPVLTGVNFRLEDRQLTITATDSFRLAKKIMPFDQDGSFNVTIPQKTLYEVRSTMLENPEEDIRIALNDKKAQFHSSKMVLQTRLLEGGFPDTEKFVPTEFNHYLTTDREELIHAIDRTVFIKNDNMIIVRLNLSQDEVVLTNRSQEIGESNEQLSGTFEGDPISISFSGSYMMDACKALKGQNVKISFTGEMKPFIIRSEEDDTITQLVLPVRTYN